MEDARKCCKELEDAEDGLRVAHVAASKACDDAKVARKRVSKVKTDYVAEVRKNRDEVGEITNSYPNNLPQLLLDGTS